jgi:pyruvate kinase
MRKAKIVCTLGPACSSLETLLAMAEEGMDVARFNFSHGEYEGHAKNLELVRQVEKERKRPLAALLDTKGPEIRTGLLKNHEPVLLENGQTFCLTTRPLEGSCREVSISYDELPREVAPGMDIFIDDGTLQLLVEEIRGEDILCKVLVGGELGERKGINVPDASLSVPTLTEKDREDIRWGLEHEMEYIAVSFVRSRDDVLEVLRVMEELGGQNTMKIIAKIETKQAVEALEEIAEVVDGMMVARGDLGVEIPTEDVPLQQKRIIDVCRAQGKPVIVATQMLDSMIRNPRPTRAEANDVANAVLDGADAVMLSGETAKGKYPLESVRTMKKIVLRVEQEHVRWGRQTSLPVYATTVPDSVSHAATQIARELHAKAILSLTKSGSTSSMVSKYRPECPIIAATPSLRTWRQLSLVWGLHPLLSREAPSIEQALNAAIMSALEEEALEEGDLVVSTAGLPVGIPGTTNMVQVHTVGSILVKGLSLSRKEATGRVCKALVSQDAEGKIRDGDILVVRETDKSFVPAMRKAGAIIAEEGGLTSHAAIVALNLGIPCIVSARGAMKELEDGALVTVDGSRGVVYGGKVKLH